jgi:hypothetical protein
MLPVPVLVNVPLLVKYKRPPEVSVNAPLLFH